MTPSSCHFVNSALASAIISLMLTGCAQWPASSSSLDQTEPGACEAGSSPADNTRLASIEQMVNEGKLYAALAQLDALGNTSPKARMIRADALRRIDKDKEAQALYVGLTGSCMSGRAHHGLGLLAAHRGDQADSIAHLKQARLALPTAPDVRNDLGYAFLLAGMLDDAQFEFLTALDLHPQDARATRNLVLLSFKRGDAGKAYQLAAKLGLDTPTTDRLALQAQNLSLPPPNTNQGKDLQQPLQPMPVASSPGA